jgi:hypothetical protein
VKKVIFYLVLLIAVILFLWLEILTSGLPKVLLGHELAIQCVMLGSLGGILYCLRAVYLNKCVKNKWDENWEVWYYLRPLTSSISGLVSFIFLKAGLIALDAEQATNAGDFGYLAFAFIAGLNVDKFVSKIEDIAKSLFGIDKSRAAKESDNNK